MLEERQHFQEQLSKARESLIDLERERVAMNQKIAALKSVVAGFEDLLRLCDEGVVEPVASFSGTTFTATAAVQRQADRIYPRARNNSFRSGVLAIVRNADPTGRKGIAFENLVEEVRNNGLETDAKTFEHGVRYAVGALIKSGHLRPMKKGMVRFNPAKSANIGEAQAAA